MQPVDPATVPSVTLRTRDRMPAIGLGTFGSDRVTHEEIAATAIDAARVGYRHFDCASVYGNEVLIGESLQTIQGNGVDRDELWITSKVWNNMHGPGDVISSCEQSLRDLRLDHLDLFLVHWPFPNHHSVGADVSERNSTAQPYVHENYMVAWRQMEGLVERGLVRNIGTSNMSVAKLQLVLADAVIAPAANEMELHPHFQQPELFDFVRLSGIVPIGFSPIGSPARPERDRSDDDSVDIDDPILIEVAANHEVHPATLCVKWAAQRGQVPIPFSTTPRNYVANLNSVTTAPLSGTEMNAIAAADRSCRLIKGQVFCWRDGQNWRDLWDEDGSIAE